MRARLFAPCWTWLRRLRLLYQRPLNRRLMTPKNQSHREEWHLVSNPATVSKCNYCQQLNSHRRIRLSHLYCDCGLRRLLPRPQKPRAARDPEKLSQIPFHLIACAVFESKLINRPLVDNELPSFTWFFYRHLLLLQNVNEDDFILS